MVKSRFFAQLNQIFDEFGWPKTGESRNYSNSDSARVKVRRS